MPGIELLTDQIFLYSPLNVNLGGNSFMVFGNQLKNFAAQYSWHLFLKKQESCANHFLNLYHGYELD